MNEIPDLHTRIWVLPGYHLTAFQKKATNHGPNDIISNNNITEIAYYSGLGKHVRPYVNSNALYTQTVWARGDRVTGVPSSKVRHACACARTRGHGFWRQLAVVSVF
eukprot:3218128-Rhodomonas_salina.1